MSLTDKDIQTEINLELNWEPSLRADDIVVGVRDGIVTLGGFVDSWSEKTRAERAVARVRGVKAIANEVEVKLPGLFVRTDAEIARAALRALEWDIAVPHDRLRVKVDKGWITLEGEVEWFSQKDAADRAVRHLTGVRGVFNTITLAAHSTPRDVKKRIKDSLHRAVDIDADHVAVEIAGHKAVLTGTVRSYAEWRDAERAARNAPGITEVVNQLVVAADLVGV